MLIQEVNIG